jgi:hypothetical protein
MLSDDTVLRYLEPGRSVVIGTVDAAGWPSCCRGIAIVVAEDRRSVVVFLPVATAAETVANVASNGRLAVVTTHPVTHVTVQLKGRSRAVRVAGEEERPTIEAYFERFADVLDSIGLPRGISRGMARWPAFAIEIEVDAVFEQTPGPRAGEPVAVP